MRSFHIILQRMRHQLLQGWNSTGMSSKSWNSFLNSNAAPSSQGSWRVFRIFDDSRIKCVHLQVRNLAEEEAVPGSTTMDPFILLLVYPTALEEVSGFQHIPTLWQCTLAGLFLIDPKSWVSKAFPPMLHFLLRGAPILILNSSQHSSFYMFLHHPCSSSSLNRLITAPRYSVPSPSPRVYHTDWSY